MGKSITSIRDHIRAESLSGKVIDVDASCRLFAPLFPHMTADQIRAEIMETVCSFGGGAVWGMDDIKLDSELPTLPPHAFR